VPVWGGVIDQVPDKDDRFEGEALEVRPDGTVRAHRGGKYRMLPDVLPRPSTEKPPADSDVKEVHTVGSKVTRADWLSNLAWKHYSDQLLWPIIWRRNRGPTFTNPNRIVPGQKIVIPVKPSLTKSEETAIRTARGWKEF
jgi:nucleoid-associated protein YgaU